MERKPWRWPGERRQQRGSAIAGRASGVKCRRLRWLRGDKRDENLELNVVKNSRSSQDKCRKLEEQRGGGPAPIFTSVKTNNINICILKLLEAISNIPHADVST